MSMFLFFLLTDSTYYIVYLYSFKLETINNHNQGKGDIIIQCEPYSMDQLVMFYICNNVYTLPLFIFGDCYSQKYRGNCPRTKWNATIEMNRCGEFDDSICHGIAIMHDGAVAPQTKQEIKDYIEKEMNVQSLKNYINNGRTIIFRAPNKEEELQIHVGHHSRYQNNNQFCKMPAKFCDYKLQIMQNLFNELTKNCYRVIRCYGKVQIKSHFVDDHSYHEFVAKNPGIKKKIIDEQKHQINLNENNNNYNKMNREQKIKYLCTMINNNYEDSEFAPNGVLENLVSTC